MDELQVFKYWALLMILSGMACFILGAWWGWLQCLGKSLQSKMLLKIVNGFEIMKQGETSDQSQLCQMYWLIDDCKQVLKGVEPLGLDFIPSQLYEDIYEDWANDPDYVFTPLFHDLDDTGFGTLKGLTSGKRLQERA